MIALLYNYTAMSILHLMSLRVGNNMTYFDDSQGLSQLSVEVVDLLEAGAERISSTLMRHDSLGRLRLERHRVDTLSTDHFIIGLTGGICSGKSRMASVLARLGATVIDCDKLGHMAYKKESRIFGQVIAAFGADIVGDDGEINRRALGKKVFAEGVSTRRCILS